MHESNGIQYIIYKCNVSIEDRSDFKCSAVKLLLRVIKAGSKTSSKRGNTSVPDLDFGAKVVGRGGGDGGGGGSVPPPPLPQSLSLTDSSDNKCSADRLPRLLRLMEDAREARLVAEPITESFTV